MITKKEDLLNTYIENDYGELRDLYLKLCDEFGISTSASRKYNIEAMTLGALSRGCSVWANLSPKTIMTCKKITLSDLKEKAEMKKAVRQKMYTEKYNKDMDFVVIGDDYIGPFVDACAAQKAVAIINNQFSSPKPRTRTEYEKVTESIFDLREEFEAGELFVDACGRVKIETPSLLGAGVQSGQIYRKVEKPVDWRDEVANWLSVDDWSEDESLGVINDAFVGLRLDYFTESQFLELCRVTLRALGEIE